MNKNGNHILDKSSLSFSYRFVILLVLNITLFLTSNIISSKLILLFGLSFTAGDLLFPITYILNDIFVEVYGYRQSKFVIYASFIANLIMIIIFYISILFPYPNYYVNQTAFEQVLMYTPRLLLASSSAYVVGSLLNAKIMTKLKEKHENNLCFRTIVSTIIGELFDTVIFILVSFVGNYKIADLFILCINVYVLKVVVEFMFTPITYRIINELKRKENIYEEKDLSSCSTF